MRDADEANRLGAQKVDAAADAGRRDPHRVDQQRGAPGVGRSA